MLPILHQNALPRPSCPHSGPLIRHGSYRRRDDGVLVLRWRCRTCGKTCSDATSDPYFRQHKRIVNPRIAFELASGMSQRRIARGVRVNRKTVVRKFLFLAEIAKQALFQMNIMRLKASTIEFDEMETFVHTKCKPLSVPIAIESTTRRILGFRVCSMPCKGRLARVSVRKYGKRKDERKVHRLDLLKSLKVLVREDAIIKSDQNPHYPSEIKIHFPKATHQPTKGHRGSTSGQGELKKVGKDPLFTINHTCSMLRENINRLRRKTWCTTKIPARLELHIALYALYHNLSFVD